MITILNIVWTIGSLFLVCVYFKQGYKNGYKKGFNDGSKEGYKEGYNKYRRDYIEGY